MTKVVNFPWRIISHKFAYISYIDVRAHIFGYFLSLILGHCLIMKVLRYSSYFFISLRGQLTYMWPESLSKASIGRIIYCKRRIMVTSNSTFFSLLYRHFVYFVFKCVLSNICLFVDSTIIKFYAVFSSFLFVLFSIEMIMPWNRCFQKSRLRPYSWLEFHLGHQSFGSKKRSPLIDTLQTVTKKRTEHYFWNL